MNELLISLVILAGNVIIYIIAYKTGKINMETKVYRAAGKVITRENIKTVDAMVNEIIPSNKYGL